MKRTLLVLGILCAVSSSAQVSSQFRVFRGAESVSLEQMLDDLAKAKVVVVGENHGHKLGHALELAILKGVQARKARTALSLEMFERDVQGVLDEYLAGHITESHFLQSARPWPAYKTDYAPMVEFARENRLPVIAANAPRRYVNIVSRKGQAALKELPRASREHLPPLPYSMDIPPGYDRMLTDLFQGAHGSAASSSAAPPLANMKESQALWDSTMADSILRFLRKNRGWIVVQINGAGHSDYGYGIADRLRKANPRLKVRTVSIKPDPGFPTLPNGKYEGAADFLMLTPQ